MKTSCPSRNGELDRLLLATNLLRRARLRLNLVKRVALERPYNALVEYSGARKIATNL